METKVGSSSSSVGRPQLRRANGPALAILLLGLFAFACNRIPTVARVPVSPEDVRRANEVAGEGDLSFARGDFYAALIKYLEAGRLNPNSEFIYNKLGITYSKLEFYTEAEAAFRRCIGLNRQYPFPYNNLGSVHFAAGDKKDAERMYKRAINIDKQVASFHVNLGTLYFEKEKFSQAMEEWRIGLRLDPDILSKSGAISLVASGNQEFTMEKKYSMARLFASLGEVDQALENLQEALNAGFTDLEAILVEPDFDPIRQDQKFIAFMKTARILLQP
jgi:tetratricopeptide (TPR) repeat protein